jgi:hypothetical protein
LAVLEKVRALRQKRAEEGFADAVQNVANAQLRADALRDVRNLTLATLGVGAAGRGLVGLINVMKSKPRKTRSGPAHLPLPYLAAPPAAPPPAEKVGGFLAGDAASSKQGIPWYTPAMMLGGMAGLGLGWKGVDAVIDSRRRAEREKELESARQDFHDALLSQYDEPLKSGPATLKLKRAADESDMVKAGRALDGLFDRFSAALEKAAVDWPNLAGNATGLYGAYAGLSGLLTGALVYDKIRKRSRRAVLEKALQRRQRRQFVQSPTEIYAVPEPVETSPEAA